MRKVNPLYLAVEITNKFYVFFKFQREKIVMFDHFIEIIFLFLQYM